MFFFRTKRSAFAKKKCFFQCEKKCSPTKGAKFSAFKSSKKRSFLNEVPFLVLKSVVINKVQKLEYSWSSWCCQSVATDSSSHPVGKFDRQKKSENGLLLYGANISLASKSFITPSLLSPHLTTFYTFHHFSFYSSPYNYIFI